MRADKDVKMNNSETLLHITVDEVHTDIVKLLLDAGADKDVKDKWGRARCMKRHSLAIDIVKLLLDAGADKEVMDRIGWTPLH